MFLNESFTKQYWVYGFWPSPFILFIHRCLTALKVGLSPLCKIIKWLNTVETAWKETVTKYNGKSVEGSSD
jgi:hypothetical protein